MSLPNSIKEIIKQTSIEKTQGFEYRASLEEFAQRTYASGLTLGLEECIRFAEWINDNYWIREPFPRKTTGITMWAIYEDGKADQLKTTSELLSQYLRTTTLNQGTNVGNQK